MNCKEPRLHEQTLVSPGLNPVGERGTYVCGRDVFVCVCICISTKVCACMLMCMDIYMAVHGFVQVHNCMYIGICKVVWEVCMCVCG